MLTLFSLIMMRPAISTPIRFRLQQERGTMLGKPTRLQEENYRKK